jgi:hypothetical protein
MESYRCQRFGEKHHPQGDSMFPVGAKTQNIIFSTVKTSDLKCCDSTLHIDLLIIRLYSLNY